MTIFFIIYDFKIDINTSRSNPGIIQKSSTFHARICYHSKLRLQQEHVTLLDKYLVICTVHIYL